MNNENSPEEARVDLIDTLRKEIREEDAYVDAGSPSLPEGIFALLADADVLLEVALSIDDVLVEEDTISGALHARLVARVNAEVERRSTAPRFLEQVLQAGREQKALTADDLAGRLNTTPDRITAVERAQVAVGTLEEADIAAWIDELDLELDVAMTALEASLLQPISAYRGDEQRRTRRAVTDFVSSVRRLVEVRRAQQT